MLQEEIVSCPVCDKDLSVRVSRPTALAKDTRYYVVSDCPHCKTAANKLERMLNGRTKIKTEKSYIKLDPRG